MKKTGIILFWLALWQIVAIIVSNKIMLVGPYETLVCLSKLILEKSFWISVSGSLLKIMAGFCLGSFLGIGLASLAFKFKPVKEILKPFVTSLKSVPVASFVILLLIWFGSKNLSLFVASIICFPTLYLNTLSGLESMDKGLLEVRKVYKVGPFRSLKYIILPGIFPSLSTGFELAVGMAWKSGVAAEVIGQPLKSMGNQLYMAKVYLETGDLFAWTLMVILLSFLCEKLIILILRLLCHKKLTQKKVMEVMK